MNKLIRPFATVSAIAIVLAVFGPKGSFAAESEQSAPLVMVVMDPLAAELACPCVKGYAQRDYGKLAKHIEQTVNRKVQVVFDESLEAATKKEIKADIVIGKKSVVEFDARAIKRPMRAVAALSDLQGLTTQTGMFVVRTDAAAQSLSELADYKILFGPEDCDEKHAAAMTSLKANGIAPPKKPETSDSCSDGAALVVEAGAKKKMAAVISSYAKPLLEGCGTIKKGDLRVVGETAPVAFIEAFVSEGLAQKDQTAIAEALAAVKDDILLCQAIESRDGFVALAIKSNADKKTDKSTAAVSKKN
jgi:ABC-type phosphate/phosphonate transport system substrate-binding protein